MEVKSEKKILFISNSTSIGGAQRCLLDLVLNLPERIHPVIVVSHEGSFLEEIKEKEIEYFVIPFRGWWYSKFRIKLIERTINNLRGIYLIYAAVEKLNIDLVYSNTLYSPVGAFLARILKIPHIWHIHEFTHLNLIQKFDYGLKLSMTIVNRYSDIIVCPSNSLKKDLLRFIPLEKIYSISNGVKNVNGVDPIYNDKFSPDNEHEFKILIIGSVIEFKGQYDAILSVNELIKIGKNVRLIIIGDGERKYINYLKDLINKLGINDYISWEGYRNNINDYISTSNLLFVCSRFETFGMVIIEAMSKGCPVIATRTGGISEIIVDGHNGLLYEIGNIADLTKKTELLINNKELYSKISENSILTCINNYSLMKYVNEIVTLIDNTLNPQH